MTGSRPDTMVREYVLGGLAAAQREEVDERLLTDPDFHAEVRATGDDLIHAYLSAELTAADRERFESFFLASPRRQERVAFMRSLLEAAKKARRAPVAALLPWAAALLVGLAAGGWGLSERRLWAAFQLQGDWN